MNSAGATLLALLATTALAGWSIGYLTRDTGPIRLSTLSTPRPFASRLLALVRAMFLVEALLVS